MGLKLKYNFKYILSVILFFSLLTMSYGSIERFTNYDTNVIIHKNDTLTVQKIMNLRNVHDVGIVPGKFEFKLGSIEDSPLNVLDHTVYDRYGKGIKSIVIENDDRSSIVLDLFTPILPGFEYVINLTYTIEYESSGIFFKRVEMPIKDESRVPILGGEVMIMIPKGRHFTHFSYEDEGVTIEDNIARFELTENTPNSILFEYSYLPIKYKNIPGSIVFWLAVNIFIFLILIIQLIRELKKNKSE